jgi:hypothetical protein
MGGYVLHAGAGVFCSHSGPATPNSSTPSVKVGGQPVVTIDVPYSIVCTATTRCISGQWSTGATRVLVKGRPVALESGSSVCPPNISPLKPQLFQRRVKAT